MSYLHTAVRIARDAHANQFRRDGYTPYIVHPWDVSKRLRGENDDVLATAWMHDVLEDAPKWNTLKLLEQGIPAEVVDAVFVMTKRIRTPYDEYLAAVKQNPIARKVKIADMLSNLADTPTEKQILKYAKGLTYLLEL